MLAGSGSMWFVIWEQAGLQVIRHQLQEQKGPPRLGQSKTASTSALPFYTWQGSAAKWTQFS